MTTSATKVDQKPEAKPRAATGKLLSRMRRPSTPIWAALVAGALMTVWWLYTYWPAPIDPSTVQPSPPGDGWGGTAIWGALAREHLNPFSPGKVMAFNAPDGWAVPWQVNIQQWPTTAIYYGVTKITGDADVAMNTYLVLGVVGTTASMAWFTARFVVDDRWIAVLAGLALGLQPLITIKAAGHTAFAHLWPLVLMLGAILIAWERPSWRTAAVAGLAAFVAMSWSGYHLLLAGVLFAAVLVLGTLVQLRSGDRRSAVIATLRMALFAGLGLLAVAITLRLVGRGADPVSAIRQNSLEALYIYSARWYEYIVPSASNWLLGPLTDGYLSARRHGSNAYEQGLYQGVTVLMLAAAGVVWLSVRRWRTAPRPSRVMSAPRIIWVIGVGVVIVAGVSSLPPMVSPLGISLPTPSRVIFEFVTTWRVYARFALVVSIGLVVLAAVGLRYVAGSGRRRLAVLTAATILIPLDLFTFGPRPTRVVPPAFASVLRSLPPGIVASYPLERGEADGYSTLYFQQFFGHPMLNLFDDTPQEGRAASLKDLSRADTVQRLSALGVTYVLAVQRPAQPGGPEVPAKPNRLLEKVAVSSWGGWPATIYRVPEDAGAFAALAAGFGPPEGATGKQIEWVQGNEGSIELAGSCDQACRGTLRLGVVGFGRQSLQVIIDGQPVRVRANARTGSRVDLVKPMTISVPVTFDGRQTVTVRASPGARPVRELVPNSADTRSLSFAATGVRFVREQ